MRIVNWSACGIYADERDAADYFEGLNEDTSKESLMCLLAMTKSQKENRWWAQIVRHPRVNLIYIELRKALPDDTSALLVIGRSEKPIINSHTGYDGSKFKPGRVKLSLNGTAYFSQFELKEMSLAVDEAETVWDNLVKSENLTHFNIKR